MPVFIDSLECYMFGKKNQIDLQNKFLDKIFCVGFNKTGTTSVEHTLREFGYSLGNQAVAEMLVEDWYRNDFDRLIRFCYTAQAFQDIPFSLPQTYRYLDKAFPRAKFILTVRDSKQQWFESLVKFHTKLFSSDAKRPPNEADLVNAPYRYMGYALDVIQKVYKYPEVGLYDFEFYTNVYEGHNRDVETYFSDRPDKLLILNVSESDAYQRLAVFLNIQVPPKKKFPWKNKT